MKIALRVRRRRRRDVWRTGARRDGGERGFLGRVVGARFWLTSRSAASPAAGLRLWWPSGYVPSARGDAVRPDLVAAAVGKLWGKCEPGPNV